MSILYTPTLKNPVFTHLSRTNKGLVLVLTFQVSTEYNCLTFPDEGGRCRAIRLSTRAQK